VKSIRGLYDPETKTLYLADWIGFQDQEETLVHELTHALQDQYFDLNAYEKNGGEVSLDRQFAKDSVVEGEAVALTLNYKLRDKNLDFTQLANIADENQISNVLEEKGRTAFGRPVPVNDVVSFAYIYGASFLQKYVKIYGWQGMGALFAHPPLSTQQVMHPEKYYLKKQVPIHIAIEDMSKGPLSGSKKIWEDSFGEYGLYLVLRQYIPEKRAFQSVKGWRGDALQVYEFPGRDQIVLMGYVVFEDTDSARDFFESYRSRLEGKYNFETIRAEETIHRASVEGTGTEVYVERLGRRVVFLEGTSTSEADKVRNELWNIKKISPQASVKR
jgi:hypothetical protein